MKSYDSRMCASARLTSLVINFTPPGSGNPNSFTVRATASFLCLDQTGNILGVKQSSDSSNAAIPYYVVIDSSPTLPTYIEIVESLATNKQQLEQWIATQITNLTGV